MLSCLTDEMGILAAARGYISGLVTFTVSCVMLCRCWLLPKRLPVINDGDGGVQVDGHVTDCASPGICSGGVQITSDWLLESRVESMSVLQGAIIASSPEMMVSRLCGTRSTSMASFILVVEKQGVFERCEALGALTRRADTLHLVSTTAIFHRLCEDRVWLSLPCILVTGCGTVGRVDIEFDATLQFDSWLLDVAISGFPDIATRACVYALASRLQVKRW